MIQKEIKVPTLEDIKTNYPIEYMRLQMVAIFAILEEKGLLCYKDKEHIEEIIKELYETMKPQYKEQVDELNRMLNQNKDKLL